MYALFSAQNRSLSSTIFHEWPIKKYNIITLVVISINNIEESVIAGHIDKK